MSTDCANTSSCQSIASSPFLSAGARKFKRLRAYIWLAWRARSDAKFCGPKIFTPLPVTTVSPATVSSQLPPLSAARSTITEPALMAATAAFETIRGAVRPGIAAVVITTSAFAMCASSTACCFAFSSAVSSRA